MNDIKEQLKSIAMSIDDLITDVESSDQIDEDSRAEIIEHLEDSMSFIADAMLVLP